MKPSNATRTQPSLDRAARSDRKRRAAEVTDHDAARRPNAGTQVSPDDPVPTAAGGWKESASRFPEMSAAYYEVRGWDVNGVPTRAKLQSLSLGS